MTDRKHTNLSNSDIDERIKQLAVEPTAENLEEISSLRTEAERRARNRGVRRLVRKEFPAMLPAIRKAQRELNKAVVAEDDPNS